MPLTFPSLRFGAFSQRRPFTLLIEAGRLRDLVPYLAMYLLTTEPVSVARCPAPAIRNWKEECGRFFPRRAWAPVERVQPEVCGTREGEACQRQDSKPI